jgi:hypothetical protein
MQGILFAKNIQNFWIWKSNSIVFNFPLHDHVTLILIKFHAYRELNSLTPHPEEKLAQLMSKPKYLRKLD